MSTLHLVLCRGAIALGLVLAGVCGGQVGAVLSANEAQRIGSQRMFAAAGVARAPARGAHDESSEGFPQRTDARLRGRKPARLLVLR